MHRFTTGERIKRNPQGPTETHPVPNNNENITCANYVNIKVEVRHGSGGNGGWMHKCGTGCDWCYDYDGRKEWELDFIEPILKKMAPDL